MIEHESKYLKIKEMLDNGKQIFQLVNTNQEVCIGYIRKRRVGRFMHWCLEPEEDTYFSNGCLKEIYAFITKLYSENKK